MRILIADDQTLFRDMLRTLLMQEEDITIVATVSNGKDALDVCSRQSIDLALMDIRMPELDGIRAAQKILTISPQTRVILLTAFEEVDTAGSAVSENIYGFLLKDIKSGLLVQAVRMAEQGIYVATKSIHNIWLQQIKNNPPAKLDLNDEGSSLAEFTPTDIQILQCLTAGMSNREIAESISYSESTVKNRISKLLNDLDLKDRTQLALFALKHHLT